MTYDKVRCNSCHAVFNEGENLLINNCLICGSDELESPFEPMVNDNEIPRQDQENLMKQRPGRWEVLS